MKYFIDPQYYTMVYEHGTSILQTSEWLLYSLYEVMQLEGINLPGKPYILIEELLKAPDNNEAKKALDKYMIQHASGTHHHK